MQEKYEHDELTAKIAYARNKMRPTNVLARRTWPEHQPQMGISLRQIPYAIAPLLLRQIIVITNSPLLCEGPGRLLGHSSRQVDGFVADSTFRLSPWRSRNAALALLLRRQAGCDEARQRGWRQGHGKALPVQGTTVALLEQRRHVRRWHACGLSAHSETLALDSAACLHLEAQALVEVCDL